MKHGKSEPESDSGRGTFNREGIFGGESEETISRKEEEEYDMENEDVEGEEGDTSQSGQKESGKKQESEQNRTGPPDKNAPKDKPSESF